MTGGRGPLNQNTAWARRNVHTTRKRRSNAAQVLTMAGLASVQCAVVGGGKRVVGIHNHARGAPRVLRNHLPRNINVLDERPARWDDGVCLAGHRRVCGESAAERSIGHATNNNRAWEVVSQAARARASQELPVGAAAGARRALAIRGGSTRRRLVLVAGADGARCARGVWLICSTRPLQKLVGGTLRRRGARAALRRGGRRALALKILASGALACTRAWRALPVACERAWRCLVRAGGARVASNAGRVVSALTLALKEKPIVALRGAWAACRARCRCAGANKEEPVCALRGAWLAQAIAARGLEGR